MDLLNFLDGAFYSRTINSPSISSKITLQDKNSSSIILSAVDQKSPYLIGGEDKSYFGEGGMVAESQVFGPMTFLSSGSYHLFITSVYTVNPD